MNSISSPSEAVDLLHRSFEPVGTEGVALSLAGGRVLARACLTDRPSPPCDVSAMDGYALACMLNGPVPVRGVCTPGQPPVSFTPGHCVQVFTGAPIPPGTWAVVQREHVIEHSDGHSVTQIELRPGQSITPRQHLRLAGENGPSGSLILPEGQLLSPLSVSALAAFGHRQIEVRRKVRVAIITTGDELYDDIASPYQIRDSNGPALEAFISTLPQAHLVGPMLRVRDHLDTLTSVIAELLPSVDVLLLTGGVSMGDFDFVPEAIRRCGGEGIFHRLPIRPGRPILAAKGPQGQAILGLPGNPLSVLVTARRFAFEAILARTGVSSPSLTANVRVTGTDPRTLHLWWYRPVRLISLQGGQTVAELMDPKSSGDVLSPAGSDGFVEVPPGEPAHGLRPFFSWSGS